MSPSNPQDPSQREPEADDAAQPDPLGSETDAAPQADGTAAASTGIDKGAADVFADADADDVPLAAPGDDDPAAVAAGDDEIDETTDAEPPAEAAAESRPKRRL